MKTNKIGLYIDVIGQAIIILTGLTALVMAWCGVRNIGAFVPLSLIALGIWQPLSALIHVVSYHDAWRKKYLLGVALWGVSLLTMVPAIGYWGLSSIFRVPIVIAPLFFGIAYFRHSYVHLVKFLATPVSFWDLK